MGISEVSGKKLHIVRKSRFTPLVTAALLYTRPYHTWWDLFLNELSAVTVLVFGIPHCVWCYQLKSNLVCDLSEESVLTVDLLEAGKMSSHKDLSTDQAI